MRILRPTSVAIRNWVGILIVVGIMVSLILNPLRLGDPSGWTGTGKVDWWEILGCWLLLLFLLYRFCAQLRKGVLDGGAFLSAKAVEQCLALQPGAWEWLAPLYLAKREGLRVMVYYKTKPDDVLCVRFALAPETQPPNEDPKPSVVQTDRLSGKGGSPKPVLLVPPDRPSHYRLGLQVPGYRPEPVVLTLSWAPTIALRAPRKMRGQNST